MSQLKAPHRAPVYPSSVLLSLYRGLTYIARPATGPFLQRRAARGKEIPERLSERFGIAGVDRPDGVLLWFHAASVGETNSILPLIAEIKRLYAVNILLTTVTVTSAKVAAARLPAGAMHQFVPLDSLQFVRRFLDHWQPDLSLFTESEIWPNLIIEASARDIPLMLLNARMSARSFKRWSQLSSLSRPLFSRFDLVLSQDRDIAERLTALGAKQAIVTGNLKFDAPPPPVDAASLANLKYDFRGRPVFLAASTHPGEDEAVIRVHEILNRTIPDLLTLIAPRHPERGEAIATLVANKKIIGARRSLNEAVDRDTEIYVADTIGEIGVFYALAPLSFIGGSLVAHGGQNPIEAVKLGSGILSGPHTFNFDEAYNALKQNGGCKLVTGPENLAAQVGSLFENPADAAEMKKRAAMAIDALGGALERTLTALAPYIQQSAHRQPLSIASHAT